MKLRLRTHISITDTEGVGVAPPYVKKFCQLFKNNDKNDQMDPPCIICVHVCKPPLPALYVCTCVRI